MSTQAVDQLARIGKTVTIKGEISGNEDIYVDGHIEGGISLSGNSLTVGPDGRVRANVTAKNVTVSGSVEGNLKVTERTEMRKTAVVTGDVQTRRIAIEEGAYFKGKLEILMENKPQSGVGSTAAAASSPHSGASSTPSDPGK
jgi:cytoskeletal protein CcmA (bactofilin family)